VSGLRDFYHLAAERLAKSLKFCRKCRAEISGKEDVKSQLLIGLNCVLVGYWLEFNNRVAFWDSKNCARKLEFVWDWNEARKGGKTRNIEVVLS